MCDAVVWMERAVMRPSHVGVCRSSRSWRLSFLTILTVTMAQDPDLKLGLEYWDTQEATINGVLGKPVPYALVGLYITLCYYRWLWRWGKC